MKDNEFVLEWLKFASDDLISVRHLFEALHPKQVYVSAYLSHQCAEKSLKAFLVAQDIEPPKIHNLEDLLKLCRSIESDFFQIESDCKRVNPYGVSSRYPNEVEVSESTAKTLIEKSQKIYDFCSSKIGLLSQGNSNG